MFAFILGHKARKSILERKKPQNRYSKGPKTERPHLILTTKRKNAKLLQKPQNRTKTALKIGENRKTAHKTRRKPQNRKPLTSPHTLKCLIIGG